ncbi:hypothetical protein AcV5_008402 [Taiwanofungus camphoratus]|nr:hypothetical protein AcV5_008402 [Antrodia cinnamomea]
MPTGGQIAQVAHGPSLAGIFMNVMLYGVMISQTFFYFSTYREDPRWMKVYVAVLFFADTLNTVFNIWWIYNVLINNFGNLEALATANWLFETEEALAGLIAMQVQMFYAWRIHRLTGNTLVVAAVVITSLVGGLSGIGTAIAVAMRPQFADFQHLKAIVILWLMGAAVCDVIIALSLSLHLRKHRTGFARTDTVVTRIMHLSLSNGLITASFALADVISFLATPRGIHIAFNYTLVKLYGNSVMTSLNYRTIISSSNSRPTPLQKDLGRGTDISNILSSNTRASRPTQLVVNVETHEMVDVADPINDLKADPEWNNRRNSSMGTVGSDTKDAVAV